MGAKPGEFSIPNGHNFTINLIFENHSRQEDARAIFPSQRQCSKDRVINQVVYMLD